MFFVIKSLDVFLTWSSDVLTLIIGEMFKTFYVRANNHLNYAHKLKSCRSIWIIDASAILSWQGHKTSQEYSLRVNAFTILRKFAKRVFYFLDCSYLLYKCYFWHHLILHSSIVQTSTKFKMMRKKFFYWISIPIFCKWKYIKRFIFQTNF